MRIEHAGVLSLFNIALCCYNENIWHGQLVFRVDRGLTRLREW
jgi:hypothetical protein